jgi:hypothetical protein
MAEQSTSTGRRKNKAFKEVDICYIYQFTEIYAYRFDILALISVSDSQAAYCISYADFFFERVD